MNLHDEVDLYVKGLAARPSADEIAAFQVICERTGLSPIARQIYLVGRTDRASGKTKYTPQTSIDGFRSIAARNPRYVGQDGPYYVESGEPGAVWTDIPPEGPVYAAKVGVRVRVHTEETMAVTYAVAKFKDYNVGGGMWTKFPTTMIAKCAEALALRKAFPAEMVGLYTAEEMAQAGTTPVAERRDTAPATMDSTPPTLAEMDTMVRGTRDKQELKALVARNLGRMATMPEEEQAAIAAAIRTQAASW